MCAGEGTDKHKRVVRDRRRSVLLYQICGIRANDSVLGEILIYCREKKKYNRKRRLRPAVDKYLCYNLQGEMEEK